jgi:FkbM family methyltransferase
MMLRMLEFYGARLKHPGKWRVHSWIRNTFNVHVDEDRVVCRNGLWWKLNPSNYVESDLFWLGGKDTWEVYHIRRLVKEGSVIFDVGANFGYYSCSLAHGLRRNCKVYAFEPFPRNYERLKENLRLNHLEGCVRPFPLGLSNVSGQVAMAASSGNTGAAHILPGAGVITLSTVDQICDEEQIAKLDFMKVDVEGFEVFVLKGGDKIIRRDKPAMLVEMNPPTLKRAGVSCEELADALEQYDYRLFIAQRKNLVPLTTLPHDEDYVDVFCIHSSIA